MTRVNTRCWRDYCACFGYAVDLFRAAFASAGVGAIDCRAAHVICGADDVHYFLCLRRRRQFVFSDINEMLWGDIGVSMLTLFRVATLEDWTDVMYETMEIYPLSWIYYLSFIFFSTFIFLNMMIGVVINVLQEEHTRVDKEHKEAPDNLSNEENLIRIERRLVAIEETLKTRRGINFYTALQLFAILNQFFLVIAR